MRIITVLTTTLLFSILISSVSAGPADTYRKYSVYVSNLNYNFTVLNSVFYPNISDAYGFFYNDTYVYLYKYFNFSSGYFDAIIELNKCEFHYNTTYRNYCITNPCPSGYDTYAGNVTFVTGSYINMVFPSYKNNAFSTSLYPYRRLSTSIIFYYNNKEIGYTSNSFYSPVNKIIGVENLGYVSNDFFEVCLNSTIMNSTITTRDTYADMYIMLSSDGDIPSYSNTYNILAYGVGTSCCKNAYIDSYSSIKGLNMNTTPYITAYEYNTQNNNNTQNQTIQNYTGNCCFKTRLINANGSITPDLVLSLEHEYDETPKYIICDNTVNYSGGCSFLENEEGYINRAVKDANGIYTLSNMTCGRYNVNLGRISPEGSVMLYLVDSVNNPQCNTTYVYQADSGNTYTCTDINVNTTVRDLSRNANLNNVEYYVFGCDSYEKCNINTVSNLLDLEFNRVEGCNQYLYQALYDEQYTDSMGYPIIKFNYRNRWCKKYICTAIKYKYYENSELKYYAYGRPMTHSIYINDYLQNYNLLVSDTQIIPFCFKFLDSTTYEVIKNVSFRLTNYDRQEIYENNTFFGKNNVFCFNSTVSRNQGLIRQYRIYANKQGYYPLDNWVELSGYDETAILLQPISTQNTNTSQMYYISGYVLRGDNIFKTPVSDILVKIDCINSVYYTDQNGYYIFYNISRGKNCCARADDMGYDSTIVCASLYGNKTNMNITITPKSVDKIDVTFWVVTEKPYIAGEYTDVSGAVVKLHKTGSNPISCTTRNNGKCNIADVRYNTAYDVIVSKSGYVDYHERIRMKASTYQIILTKIKDDPIDDNKYCEIKGSIFLQNNTSIIPIISGVTVELREINGNLVDYVNVNNGMYIIPAECKHNYRITAKYGNMEISENIKTGSEGSSTNLDLKFIIENVSWNKRLNDFIVFLQSLLPFFYLIFLLFIILVLKVLIQSIIK